MQFKLSIQKAKEEAAKGIPTGDRVVSAVLFLFSSLMLIYFLNHELQNTGFYTEEFGIIGKSFNYGFFIMWIITAGLEGILGLRFYSRFFDVFGGIVFAAVATLYLFIVFPFDFEFFKLLLPENIQFIFSWITSDIARVLLFLSFLFHFIAIFISPVAYKFIEKRTEQVSDIMD